MLQIYTLLKKKYDNAILLFPPVPESYFVNRENKINDNKIRLTFLGRIDPRKGIIETIKLFDQLNNDSGFDCKIYGIIIPEDKRALSIYSSLISQKKIKFIEIDRQNYSTKIDKMVQNILKSTDVFVQPYRNLRSTVDTPLLLLEAMASLCVFLTTQVENISDIYGPSKYIIPKNSFSEDAIKILKKISIRKIEEERERIQSKVEAMNFCQSQIGKRFLNAIET